MGEMTEQERYAELLKWEGDSNRAMISMLESVPESNRSDPRFQQALNIAGHIAACRENWLIILSSSGEQLAPWSDAKCRLDSLAARFEATGARWAVYLEQLGAALKTEADFEGSGWTIRMVPEDQVLQLFLHACYHRGQVAILVDQLGGTVADTDYVYWKYPGS